MEFFPSVFTLSPYLTSAIIASERRQRTGRKRGESVCGFVGVKANLAAIFRIEKVSDDLGRIKIEAIVYNSRLRVLP